LKPLLKYPVTFLILLLGGLSQLCLPLLKGNTPSLLFGSANASVHGQALDNKSAGALWIEQEEEKEEKEDERESLKQTSAPFLAFDDVSVHRFYNCVNAASSGFKHFACFSSFQSTYLVYRVFRL
jgi:hypothetical protein